MQFPEDAPVKESKKKELRERLARLGIELSAVEESFVRGSGPGGQKINKTSSTVQLRYEPLGLTVRCGRERSQAVNRFVALRKLVDRIEERTSPETARRLSQERAVRERKRRRERRRRNREKAEERPGG